MQLDIAAFDTVPLAADPYPHVIVPGFLGRDGLSEVSRDFPRIDMGGSFPPDALSYGRGFADLLAAMEGEAVRHAVERKFGIDLAGRPSMCTVRGMTRERDGQIHRDALFKIVTLLLYLNDGWTTDGGRLRVLRSNDNLEDYVTEIPPEGGTLFAFLCTPNAWHGHKPFDGPRRSIQLNYVSDVQMMNRELARHRFSARMKKVKRIFGFGRAAV
ncbi:MAG TPA: 2OG-Fe(II) oxygenase [Magnetospirillaceae bacterium]|jgi:hypothetical protein